MLILSHKQFMPRVSTFSNSSPLFRLDDLISILIHHCLTHTAPGQELVWLLLSSVMSLVVLTIPKLWVGSAVCRHFSLGVQWPSGHAPQEEQPPAPQDAASAAPVPHGVTDDRPSLLCPSPQTLCSSHTHSTVFLTYWSGHLYNINLKSMKGTIPPHSNLE